MCFRRLQVVSLLLVLGIVAEVRGEAELPERHRVPNPDGVCWFACVESIGNCRGYASTIDLCDAVRAKNIGTDGATAQAQWYWTFTRKFHVSKVPYSTVWNRVSKGQHVILVYRTKDADGADSAHAVVLLDADKQGITCFDPNFPKQQTRMLWSYINKRIMYAQVVWE